MSRHDRPTRLTWTSRLRGAPSPAVSDRAPSPRPLATRPGIAARWKPRDRVNAAGN